MKVLAEERQQLIIQLLKENSVVKLQEICEQTDCSESSARRDLQLLEERGLLVRVHGGAKVKHSLQRELDMSGKAAKNVTEKEIIAKAAAALVANDDVIYLDAGTTTLAMIPYLKGKEQLTVVTNGVLHASRLADQRIKTILIGGELKATTKAIIGVKAVKELQELRFNKAFLGTNGIHQKYGFTTPDPNEAAIKKVALEQSEATYVLADPSKFDAVSFVKIARLAEATIITSSLKTQVSTRYRRQTTIQEEAK
ncbi:transcription regulator of fructose operon [Ligilactobacillus apodemi DSM 16634 = JCM 16172]|uniref:Transcription regulator of fructose operon n=1 Tax=Ligilactobacillus apodemi DSM 16634 = JCM 16172 TaxID=1423724 RepID=A0A0R1U7S0_9LACO|nr:DeoR/GlpR family DNA-binding transcription regulator [Ligilactobacillus apodemi]KRL87482.1 transcription regulator of fructose operon [Ligilactobacillus apodemi DSM 16634 = JCM 16172]MCR1901956.1 DeoR/GlpR family DNA-binding transcription regulator [Ligilactobacillus apodemi]